MIVTDPKALVANLDAAAIRERLDRLDEEQRALRVLLRAAVARDRYRTPRVQNGGHQDGSR